MSYHALTEELSALETRLRDIYKQVDSLPTPEQSAQIAEIRERMEDIREELTGAGDSSPADGTAPAPTDNSTAPSDGVGGEMPPEPPPEVAPPVSSAAGPDLSQPIHLAPPVPGETVFLPLTGADQYDDIIREADAALVRVNDTAFDLNPDDLWNPESVHLGGADGPENISSLVNVTASMNDITARAQGAFTDLGDTINSQPEGTWPDRFREMYAPTLRTANDGVAEGGPVATAAGNLSSAGTNITDAFSSFHAAIGSARGAIADLYGTDEFGNPYLDTSRTLAMDPNIAQPALAALAELDASNASLATAIDPWSISTRLSPASDGGAGAESPSTSPVGSPATPATPSYVGSNSAGSAGSSGGDVPSEETTNSDSALDSLFGTPQQSVPMMQSPMSGTQMPSMSMPTMPTIPDIPTVGEEAPTTPGDTELSSDDSMPADAKPSHTPPSSSEDNVRAAPAMDSSAATAGAVQNAIPRPGDPVRSGALGADGKLLDKDGDGRMDRDALAPTRENADRDGDGLRDEFVFPVEADGKTYDVTCDDPRLAEMMTRLADAERNSPMTILEAAKASGLELEDYGQKIDTLSMKPGDVVTGTDTGMYIGEGNVLTEGGEVKKLVDVMDYRISNPEVYRLDVPELPSSEDVIPDVPEQRDPPADAPSHTEPAAAPEAAAHPTPEPSPEPPPVEEPDSAAAQPSSASSASAPSPSTVTDDALEAMLSGGSSSGIQDVEYQGYAMGGPDDSASAPAGGIQDVEYQGYAMGGPDSTR